MHKIIIFPVIYPSTENRIPFIIIRLDIEIFLIKYQIMETQYLEWHLEQRLLTNIYHLPIRGGGDGGMYTNSSDMLTFWTKLFCNELISKMHLEKVFSHEVEIFKNQKYGFGVYISDFEKYECYFADGSDVGVGFTSLYVPEIELNINIFSNMSDGNKDIIDFIRKNGSDLLSL